MIKKLLVTFIIMSIGIICSKESVFADDISLGDKINFGVNCSAVLPTEDGTKTGIYTGGLLSYDIIKYFAIGVEAGYAQLDFEEDSVKLGTLQAVPLLGDIILKAPIEMDQFTLIPYGVVGMGALFSSFDESGIVKDAGIRLNTDTAFLMKFGGGIDFYMTKNIALNFEASYIMADIDANASWRGQTYATDSLTADSWLIGGGLKVRF